MSMSPIVWRPPTRLLMADADPVQPGGDRAGWVSGTLRNALGGARVGSGLVAGAVTIVNGSIAAIAAPTNGGTGYPANARFEVVINGDGRGAKAWANTNASGIVTSFSIWAGGTGYTTASVALRAAAAADVYFDCGPDWHQYLIAVAGARDLGGAVGLLEISGGSGIAGPWIPTISGNLVSEVGFHGLEHSAYPHRSARLHARYLRLRYHVALSLGSGAGVSLMLQAA